MFGKSINLFKILGFEIRVDISWIFLAALITWSLSRGLFPEFYKGLPASSYWWMGVAGALGLFISIIFHELAHSLVARRYGIVMKGITLFIFGGVAEMEDDPPNPKAEFWMAIVGPLFSLCLSAMLFGVLFVVQTQLDWPLPVYGVLAYLAWLNLVLAIFNLLPAFPLDGGRVLRSILWHWKKDLRWATSIASRVGSGLGLVLIIMGVISFFTGNLVGGFWWMMIGFFVRMAATRAYQHVLAKTVFRGEKVRDIMVTDPVVVSRSTSLDDFIHDYVYQYHYQMYPVISFGKLSGCVTVNAAVSVPRHEWTRQTVGAVAMPCDDTTTVSPESSADYALTVMNKTGNSRLMVVENEELVGVVTLKDMLKLLSVKVGQEGQG